MSLLTVSGSPHVHAKDNVSKIMLLVIIALLPVFAASVYMFGLGALKVLIVSIVASVLFEWLIQKFLIKGPNSITDYSAIVTGMLLAFNVPSNLPVWILIIGAFVSIVVGKMSFGGLGKNPFNPALVGRVFMLISFPVPMTSWPKPIESASQLTDVITGPTPLGILKESSNVAEALSNPDMPDYMQMFFGNMGGSAGEISAIAILIGGLFLLFTKVITWHIPLSFLMGALFFAGTLWLIDDSIYIDPLFHLIAGGMMLGAFFMATDMVSSPVTKWGMLIFGFMGGVLTIIIRVFGAYPEGVSFAILIMNAFVPLLDKIKPKRFGKELKNG